MDTIGSEIQKQQTNTTKAVWNQNAEPVDHTQEGGWSGQMKRLGMSRVRNY